MDLTEITDLLHTAARSVGAEVTSPWFYLQLGLILAGGGIAFAAGAAVRSRVDLTARAASWPAPLRLFMQVLVPKGMCVCHWSAVGPCDTKQRPRYSRLLLIL